MKVLFIIYGSLDQISGGYLYDAQVAAFLRRQGDTVDVFSLKSRPYLLCLFQNLRFGSNRLPAPTNYDTVIVDELVHASLFAWVRKVRKSGEGHVTTLVHHLRSSEPGTFLRRFSRFMERCLLEHSNFIIVNSRTTAQVVHRLLRREIAIETVVPGTLDLIPKGESGYKKQRSPDTTVRLLITGNVIPRKGHDILIRLLGDCLDLCFELRIVGGAPQPRFRRRVQRMIRNRHMTDQVRWLGRLSREDLLREYGAADIFVFPSRYEGFGISLAEAMRAGLPVVAFASGALADWITDPELIQQDEAAFGRQLRRLISDADYRLKVRERVQRQSDCFSTWEQTGRSFRAVLLRTLSLPKEDGDGNSENRL